MPKPDPVTLSPTDHLPQQARSEIRFWHQLAASYPSLSDYVSFRRSEYEDKTHYFQPYWDQSTRQSGALGLEVGCGCVSVLSGHGLDYIAVDPLSLYYQEIAGESAYCRSASAENLPFPSNHFTWIMCVNMIDHTPNPAVALAEMHRVLVPGGRLFFEVNFDDYLYAEHYEQWTREMVDERLGAAGFEFVMQFTVRVPEHNQSRFWGVYEKPRL